MTFYFTGESRLVSNHCRLPIPTHSLIIDIDGSSSEVTVILSGSMDKNVLLTNLNTGRKDYEMMMMMMMMMMMAVV